jgi:hypothetical protein
MQIPDVIAHRRAAVNGVELHVAEQGHGPPVILAKLMDGWVDDLRARVFVDGAGHWVQQEAPAEVDEALLGFLRSIGH